MFFTKRKYIIRSKPYIISRRRYIIICLPIKTVPRQMSGPISVWNPLWNFASLKGSISVYKETGDDFFKNRLRLRIIYNYYYILNF